MRNFLLLFFLPVFPLFAQSVLSLREAIQLGLAYNFEVKIARNEVEIARGSNTAGMAGFLPSASFSLNGSMQNSNISQRFASGLVVDRPGVRGSGLNGGLQVNWIFFDGGRMFIARKRLGRQLNAAELRLNNQLFAFADTVSAAYYQTVLSGLELRILQQSRKTAEERLRIAREQQQAGTRPASDAIQAQIDIHLLGNRIMAQEKQLEFRKGALNLLIGREPDVDFLLSDSIALPEPVSYQEVKKRVTERNPALRIQREGLEISRLGLKEIRSRSYPQIGLNMALNYQRSSNSAGFALFNRNLGPFAGLSLSLPLFNGVPVRQQLSLAERQLNTEELRLNLAENRLMFQLWRVILNMETWLESLKTEGSIQDLAAKNLRLVQDRFRMGLATGLDVRDAEVQLENSKLRMQQCRFQARLAGNQLLRLTAELNPEELK